MKFGRKAPRPTMRSVRSAFVFEEHLNNLGPAPTASNDYVAAVDAVTGGDWGMMGNDAEGDCTCADPAHTLMLRTANVGKIVIPTLDDVNAMYKVVSGWNGVLNDPSDAGADETTVCEYMESTGLCGHKSVKFGSVDWTNLDHLKWCIQLFGACRIGFQVPAYAMDQFNAGQPWDVSSTADSTIVGEHDVPFVKYDGTGLIYAVTWGKLQPVTLAFLAMFNQEAHAEVFPDWVQANGLTPPGFNLSQLVADLPGVA